MPNLIPLSEIQKQLPAFVTIYPDTYKGARYKAKFHDAEYKEDFECVVKEAIRLKRGCRSRGNAMRSASCRKYGAKKVIPIELVIAKLPDYLTIDATTYKGVREKATFRDSQYGVSFERIVANVIRDGKGYCAKREEDAASMNRMLIDEQINDIVSAKYNGAIQYLSGYSGYKKSCLWKISGKTISCAAGTILSGKYFQRASLTRWRAAVLTRDWFCCQKCGNSERLDCHHIISWVAQPERLLDVHNGITLCGECHQDYHAKYKSKETEENFHEWLDNGQKSRLVRDRLSGPWLIPPLPNSRRRTQEDSSPC